ncbi:MAG: PorP/SprF family type IX secretion system membrane protein [Crocinitomicaceae bacterium]|nr:PorP/SprF family type IX secretion system membrane protein [Crocinitomicaceae bacterium]
MNIPENFDRWMFDYKEGNLSGAEKEAFENFLIQNPQYETEVDAWSNAFIENEDFVYPHAEELEKDRKVLAGWYGYAAAAVALLLVGTSVMYFTQSSDSLINGFNGSEDVVAEEDIHNKNVISPVIDENYTDLVEEGTHFSAHNDGVVANEIHQNIALNDENNTSVESNVTSEELENGSLSNSDNTNSLETNSNYTNDNLSINDDFNYEFQNPSDVTNPETHQEAIDQEVVKYEGTENTSKYQGNPDDSELNFDMADIDVGYKAPKGSKFKKMVRKIERMFDYPVGLTNLRDPDYLLPNNSIVASNPGFAGGMLTPRTEINYRNQWFGSSQNSQELTMSFDNYYYRMRGGVGVVLNAKDYQYGQFGDYNMSLIYSPKIILGKNIVFEPAVKLTLGALNANGNKLDPESGIELQRGRILNTPAAQQMQGQQQLWYKDYGLGFVLNTKWFFAGFSAENLSRHYENVYNEEGYATPTSAPLKLSGVVGFDYLSNNKKLSLSPFAAYEQYGDRQELWAGASCRVNKFTFGGSVSHKLDFTASIGLKFEKFKLAYQYDQTKTALTNESLGSHNLTIRFNGKSKNVRGIR